MIRTKLVDRKGFYEIWYGPKKSRAVVNWIVGVPLLFTILICAAIAIPPYIKYNKRSRTAEAMKHVEAIHQALMDWKADSEAERENGKIFSNTYLHEESWLSNGGEHYTYSFTETMREDGQWIPEVTATARNNAAIYGEVIVSMPSGESTVSKVSHSY